MPDFLLGCKYTQHYKIYKKKYYLFYCFSMLKTYDPINLVFQANSQTRI